MVEKEYICRTDEECIWRVVDNETIIITKDGKLLHRLNEVGTEIWDIVDGSLTINEVIAHICSEFDVAEQVAKEDVMEFIDDLLSKKLLAFVSS